VSATPLAERRIPDWRHGVLEELYEHALADPTREFAGVLLGTDHGDAKPVEVTGLLPAIESAPGKPAVFTHQVWAGLHRRLARGRAAGQLVGWYVSRPGYGVFLSPDEVRMHQRYFAGPGQIALVIDSRRGTGGLFGWTGRRLELLHQGPIAGRYVRPRRPGAPWRAVVLLVLCGALLGLLLWLVTGAAHGPLAQTFPLSM
jgi:proteasome lid subunit RPN8/RPN11